MAGLAHRGSRGAPSTIFTTNKLSPRQIATKAMTLGCKKLDRDDKKSKPQYHVRERLLLCNTIAYAEQVLNQRTRRTNRRVMAAEEDDAHFDAAALSSSTNSDSTTTTTTTTASKHHHHEEHSPLRSSSSDEDDDEEDGPVSPTTNAVEKKSSMDHPSITTYNNTNDDYLLPGCRRLVKPPMITPIVA